MSSIRNLASVLGVSAALAALVAAPAVADQCASYYNKWNPIVDRMDAVCSNGPTGHCLAVVKQANAIYNRVLSSCGSRLKHADRETLLSNIQRNHYFLNGGGGGGGGAYRKQVCIGVNGAAVPCALGGF